MSPVRNSADQVLSGQDLIADSPSDVVIPILAEELAATKRTVETGTVRLTKRTEERTETLDIPLKHVRWQVEHVPVNQVVGEQPGVRVEGETTIYPVVEERLVVTREIVLVEEVRVTRSSVTTQEASSHVLKSETLSEERLPANAAG